MTLTDIEQLQRQAEKLDGRPVPGLRMTEDEFVAWLDEDIRAEWVDGEVILMSPANYPHADLNSWLDNVVRGFVEHHDLGRSLVLDLQVRLAAVRSRRQPDLLFVAKSRLDIIRNTYLDGPPDLIMEIISPDSQSRDRRDKYREYEAAGVREYWIIDLLTNRLEVYALAAAAGRYRRIDQADDDAVRSTVLPGFYLRPNWLFQSPLPKVATVLKELGVR